MNKLKKVTNKEIEKFVPKAEIGKIKKLAPYKLIDAKPLKKREDTLINIEIAFRKCKRVGVFD